MRRCILHAGVLLALTAHAASAGDINISQFVFRDLNRNGIYEVGEPPYSGIPIRLEQEGRDPVVEESNLAGFANFSMSADEPDHPITAPGPVSFHAALPEGLGLTTGNPVQNGTIEARPRTPAGLVLDQPNSFMGVAPDLIIRTSASGLRAMTCAQGNTTVVADLRPGAFVCDVTPGRWRVTWELEGGTRVERDVDVTDWPLHIPATPAEPGAGTELMLTFDDFLTSENILEMPAFGGYRFHNLVVAHRAFYSGWGYVNGTSSGEFSAYNSSGHAVTISSERPFEVRSMSVGVAWPSGTRGDVIFTALRDGEVVFRESFVGSNIVPIRFEPRWSGIDTVLIEHQDYWQVVIDDLILVQ